MAEKITRYMRNETIFGKEHTGLFDQDGEVDSLFLDPFSAREFVALLRRRGINVVDERTEAQKAVLLRQTDCIRVTGHRGTWYVIDRQEIEGKLLFLVESEVWGDEVPCLILDVAGELVLEDVYNGLQAYIDHIDYLNYRKDQY